MGFSGSLLNPLVGFSFIYFQLMHSLKKCLIVLNRRFTVAGLYVCERWSLNPQSVQIGIMDGLPGLESAFRESFVNAKSARCWVHSLRNAMAKTPERLRIAFKKRAHQIMYARSENDAREAFKALKSAMGNDADRAVLCLERDIESLLVHYKFDQKFWRTLRTTNPIERVNKELKRRTKSMETVGERTLNVVLAFVAMRLEYHWQLVPVDSVHLEKIGSRKQNQIEAVVADLLH